MEEQKKDVTQTTTERTEDSVKEAEVVASPTVVSDGVEKTQINKNIIFAFIAGVLVALVGYFLVQSWTSKEVSNQTIDEVGMVDPTVVVASVNGVDLNGKELNQQLDQFAQLSGAANFGSLDEATQQQLFLQAVDAIVNSELIAQAAEENDVTVSEEEMETEYARLVEQVGGEEAAEARLQSLDTTVEAFKEDLSRDILIAKYLENQAGDLSVTEEEINDAYARIKESMGENTPELETVRPQLEAQVMGEKQQTFLSELLQGMREGADIEILI